MSLWALRGGATVASALFSLTAFAEAGDVTRADIEKALPQLEAYIESQMTDEAIPGAAVSIVFEDEVVYLAGFGIAEVGGEAKVDEDTVFQIASYSKPIASTVVAAIIGRGAIKWDTRIADLDPEFRLFDAYPTEQLTLRDLFSHRSGLPGFAGNELELLGFERDTILERLRLVRPSSSFRSGYSYSNFGLTEGGVAAAKSMDMTWADASDVFLYGPLGMLSTSSRYEDFMAAQNRASLHVPYEGQWQALAKRNPDPQSPAGGVSSTARDLAKWMRLQLAEGSFEGQQVVDAAALAATHQPVFPQGRHRIYDAPSAYGLGWGVNYTERGEMWTHAGAFSSGARTVVILLPEQELGITVLTNAFPTGFPEAVANTFLDLVMTGQSTRDWAGDWGALYSSILGVTNERQKSAYAPLANALPPLASDAYSGTFANPYFGEALVDVEAGQLFVRLGPEGVRQLPLRHFNRDVFVYYPSDETPDVPFGVTFSIGPGGRAVAVEFEDLGDAGFGSFPRVEE